jgi:hypothetical protein
MQWTKLFHDLSEAKPGEVELCELKANDSMKASSRATGFIFLL